MLPGCRTIPPGPSIDRPSQPFLTGINLQFFSPYKQEPVTPNLIMKTPRKIMSRLLAGATLLASFYASTSALADYPGTVLSQGPEGYWRFSETTPIINISDTA